MEVSDEPASSSVSGLMVIVRPKKSIASLISGLAVCSGLLSEQGRVRIQEDLKEAGPQLTFCTRR